MEDNNNISASDTTDETGDSISQIFDKIIKRILYSFSKPAVINLINGLFNENFPPDSEITYNSTENIDSKLKRTVSDIIITLRIGNRVRRFHMESQINDDNTIVLRVFEYGFQDALRNQAVHSNKISLPFPAPVIIFLEHTESTPDKVILELDFGEHGKIEYTVPAMKFLSYSVEDLCKKKMTILLPLYLLKLRREIENAKHRKRKKEEIIRQSAKRLKKLINEELLPAILENEKSGNITHSDTFEMLQLLSRLYKHLYGYIEEFRQEEVGNMLTDILELEYDVKLEEALQEARQEASYKTYLETQKQIARELKAEGVDIEIIAKTTKLAASEIEKL